MGIEVLADLRASLGTTDFSTLLPRIRALKPDILILNNFGRGQQISISQATDFGLKRTTRIVAPILLFTSRLAVGPTAFEGVVGGTSYYWGIESDTPSARAFNDRYRRAYPGKLPSDYGALGYAGVRSVLLAVKQAGTTDTEKVIDALQTLKYDTYKAPQHYRACAGRVCLDRVARTWRQFLGVPVLRATRGRRGRRRGRAVPDPPAVQAGGSTIRCC